MDSRNQLGKEGATKMMTEAKPLQWHGTNISVTTRALNRAGGRYTINRWGTSWVLVYLPTGDGTTGHQIIRVSEPRTLPKMKRAAAEHFATVRSSQKYDEHNLCVVCGQHIADPHSPECPNGGE